MKKIINLIFILIFTFKCIIANNSFEDFVKAVNTNDITLVKQVYNHNNFTDEQVSKLKKMSEENLLSIGDKLASRNVKFINRLALFMFAILPTVNIDKSNRLANILFPLVLATSFVHCLITARRIEEYNDAKEICEYFKRKINVL